jgi:hypothetical protein
LNNKGYLKNNVVEYEGNSKPQHDLILGTETMKELGIAMDLRAKTITVDEITLPTIASTICKVLAHSVC